MASIGSTGCGGKVRVNAGDLFGCICIGPGGRC